MTATLPPLPWEILAYLVTFVPQQRLLPVILTCHAFRNLGEPLLYRHITLANCPIRSLYLFRTLLDRQELCEHVRTFHPADVIRKSKFALPRMIVGDRESSVQAAYFSHRERVLARLCHVENISIPKSTVENFASMAPVSRIKKYRDPGFWGVQELAAFLDVLPEITHLELPSTFFHSQEYLQVQPNHARYLEGLVCATYAATILVPFRPIKQLFLVWDRRSSDLVGMGNFDLMEVMAQSTEVIKSLGLLFGYRANRRSEIEHVFTAAAKYLPDVEELTIWVKFWKLDSPGLELSLIELSESLSSFRKLRTLDFNGSTGWGVPYFDHRRNAISTVYTRILQDWSERCPTLERVTFPNGMVWIKEPVLTRFKPSKRRPLSLPRITPPSAPSQRIGAMLPGVEEAPSVESMVENTPRLGGVLTHEDATLNDTSNMEFASRANPPSPNLAAHTDPHQTTSMTSYRWRCLNQYLPRSDRAPRSSRFPTRIQRSELGWGEPMFKKDLKGGWPRGLPTGSSS